MKKKLDANNNYSFAVYNNEFVLGSACAGSEIIND